MNKQTRTFYVATDGNDQWSGAQPVPNSAGTDGPFASLTRARDAIRGLKATEGLQQPVQVLVREGTYHLSQPLRLSGGDSGTARFPITYRAHPGEKPVLSGGQRITHWQPYQGEIVCAHLPEVLTGRWWFRQLFYNGRRMIRARYPKYDVEDPTYGGWAFVETPVPARDELDKVAKLPLDIEWRFKTDPEKAGEAQGWPVADHDDKAWEQLRTDQPWHRQGYEDFHGTAWYRLRFTMPEGFDIRKYLWLNFGAVDKEAVVYIDGKKVFEHTRAATGLELGQLWDRPFKFDARPFLQPAQEHVITVRVSSEHGQGGIWRPVALVSADAEVSPVLLSDIVQEPVAFRYEPGVFPHRWTKPEQGEVFIIPGKSWFSDIIPINEVDFEERTIRLARVVGPSCNTLGAATHILSGNRFYVENMLEDLDQPGEWCLDTDTGTLYFWPPEGDIEAAQVSVPTTGRLIQMIGTQRDPLSHVTIRGFTLTQTLAEFPTPQSYYKTPNAGQAVDMENTEDCAVADNFFDTVGGDAIRLQNDNARNRIMGNEIAQAGAYGIFLGSIQRGFCPHDPVSGDIPSPPEWHRNPEAHQATVAAWPRSTHHLITNNHIHHVGHFEKHAQGIAFFGVSAVDVVVSHNLIHHTPRFGIGLMSGFGRVIIEYNDLHDLSLETCDTGGICSNRWYTYDKDAELCQGPIIRFNRVRDVWGCGAYEHKMEPGGGAKAGGRIWVPYYSWAIYFDNAPMDVLVYGNICARNTLGGIMISHYCKNVTVENNIFLDSDQSQAYLLLAGEMSEVRFRRNIFSYTNPDADFLRLSLGPDADLPAVITEFDENLYCTPPSKELAFNGLPGEAVARTGMAVQEDSGETLATWRNMGFDRHSLFADPRFVDPANDNYTLQPDSPAFELGFQPIDADSIGLLPDDGESNELRVLRQNRTDRA